jgi:hypothetical protein
VNKWQRYEHIYERITWRLIELMIDWARYSRTETKGEGESIVDLFSCPANYAVCMTWLLVIVIK